MIIKLLKFILAGICLQATCATLQALPVKISFLNNDDALKQTADFLASKGCDSDSVNLFSKVVHWNNESPLGFDSKKFPKDEKGFYSFQSVSKLIDALPQPIITADHPDQLNCFDFAILLAGNSIQIGLQPDSLAGPFIAPVTLTNNNVAMALEQTPGDAFNVTYPQWQGDGSKAVFTETRQNKRVCLTAVFNSFAILPLSTTRADLGSSLFAVLQSRWKRDGITFPTNMEVVICHCAEFDQANSVERLSFAFATHTGLLFPNGDQYVYLEKAGNRGPYVRLDFTERKDLLPWLKSVIKSTAGPQDHLFATFNDREIDALDDPQH